jgi:hypothetical protein
MHTDMTTTNALGEALRALPPQADAPYGFAEFERRGQLRSASERRLARGGRLIATALLVLFGSLLYLRFNAHAPGVQEAPQLASRVRTVQPRAAAVLDGTVLPREPALVRVGTRTAVYGLEDRIAQVDDILSAARSASTPPARLQALQNERARLLGSLVQVRYAEALADASD